jgi:hypothetical protein
LKLILRPTQQFEFDMPAVKLWIENIYLLLTFFRLLRAFKTEGQCFTVKP